MKLDGKNKHKSLYEIDIIGTDPFSLRELGVVNLEKSGIFTSAKIEIFYLKHKKDLLLQKTHFEYWPDPVTLGGVELKPETGKRENWGVFILGMGDWILMKLDI